MTNTCCIIRLLIYVYADGETSCGESCDRKHCDIATNPQPHATSSHEASSKPAWRDVQTPSDPQSGHVSGFELLDLSHAPKCNVIWILILISLCLRQEED